MEVLVPGRGQSGRRDRFLTRLPRSATLKNRSSATAHPRRRPNDKSGANLAAFESINAGRETPISIRQSKYLNNIVEQDHRAIKRGTRPMLGFKNLVASAFSWVASKSYT
ncbi:DDE-type integrase/transposase/recombinase [Paraburkholderia sp. BR10937]|uniref:DDE-type integrase/transposase/recombinase n=1 Tax=unclassified Paraburkholderia TaxID=2615204 RepID=UPI0034D351AF